MWPQGTRATGRLRPSFMAHMQIGQVPRPISPTICDWLVRFLHASCASTFSLNSLNSRFLHASCASTFSLNSLNSLAASGASLAALIASSARASAATAVCLA
eukprot:CAMPEP_0182906944 /NCGR_PEP_ID=MMETSP0034_2-20130328/34130_1 /TAXON_ID=156128 /ORGANISM="Nephroselmis pyriformis, Strain CCMP717" /LENGTH=101 /DNA_ID=CAMNT_0025042763 /DNA_START=212 /DNA_END=514 /DNA_ORIENTATION=+